MSRVLSRCLALVTAALLATGILVAVSRHVLAKDDPYSAIGAPWEPWVLAAHVLAAPLFLFVFGAVFPGHVLGHLRDPRSRQRRSGMIVLALATTVSASGYLLQVATAERLRSVLSWGHLALGSALGVGYLAHAGRRRAVEPSDGRLPAVRPGLADGTSSAP